MTPEQIMAALNALGVRPCVRLDDNQRWFLDVALEVAEGGMLKGFSPHAPDPLAAVVGAWKAIQGKTLLVGHNTTANRRVRWNGFMWLEAPDEQQS